jgi:radical SAM-linked protein
VKDCGEPFDPPKEKFPTFGNKSETVSRYLAFYSKEKGAKYLSHADMNNIIQRGFRRAGILVSYSKGFHPKMILSYPPALPLGMEGKAEVIEFRSEYQFPCDEFARHLNKFLPPGVKFLSIERIAWTALSLVDRIRSIIYSVDLNAEQIIEAIENSTADRRNAHFNIIEKVEELVVLYKKNLGHNSMGLISFDSNEQKLLLDVRFDPRRLIRPQDIVSDIFGIQNPVYDMARERIVFKT